MFIGSVDNDGIYRSTDQGNSWSVSNTGFKIPIFNGYRSPGIESVMVDSSDGAVYVATGWVWADNSQGGDGVWKSTDNGTSWFHIGLDSLYVCSLAMQNGKLYAATYGSGVFYLSSDSAWNHIASPAVGTIAAQGNAWFLQSTKYGLLVGFNNWGLGVYLYNPIDLKGPSWKYLGFSGKSPESVALDSAGYIYVGEQMGMYKSTETLEDIVLGPATHVIKNPGVAETFTLSQNYPNPFNPSTNISFSLPKAAQTNLTVYNVLGQKVITLVEGFLQAGNYTYQFDASRLASGVYIYRLEAGNFVKTMKMVLMK